MFFKLSSFQWMMKSQMWLILHSENTTAADLIRCICKILAGMQDFFREFGDNISVRRFDYGKEVKGTVLEEDPYFGSEATVRAAIPAGKMASYSDLVRYILLHNYGGLWWVALLILK